MKIAVIGAGSIGGVLAARLALTGHDVVAVARGAHLDAIRSHGLTLVDRLDAGRTSVARVAASDDPAAFGVQDVVFIGLKAHAIPAMLPRLAPLIGPDTIVVPAINGLPWWYFQREGGAHDGLVVRERRPARRHGARARCRSHRRLRRAHRGRGRRARRRPSHRRPAAGRRRDRPVARRSGHAAAAPPRGRARRRGLRGAPVERHPLRRVGEADRQPELQSGRRADVREHGAHLRERGTARRDPRDAARGDGRSPARTASRSR